MLAFRSSYFLKASVKTFIVFLTIIPRTMPRRTIAARNIMLIEPLTAKHIAIEQMSISGALTAIRIIIWYAF